MPIIYNENISDSVSQNHYLSANVSQANLPIESNPDLKLNDSLNYTSYVTPEIVFFNPKPSQPKLLNFDFSESQLSSVSTSFRNQKTSLPHILQPFPYHQKTLIRENSKIEFGVSDSDLNLIKPNHVHDHIRTNIKLAENFNLYSMHQHYFRRSPFNRNFKGNMDNLLVENLKNQTERAERIRDQSVRWRRFRERK